MHRNAAPAVEVTKIVCGSANLCEASNDNSLTRKELVVVGFWYKLWLSVGSKDFSDCFMSFFYLL